MQAVFVGKPALPGAGGAGGLPAEQRPDAVIVLLNAFLIQ
jgi:hypothetical protein